MADKVLRSPSRFSNHQFGWRVGPTCMSPDVIWFSVDRADVVIWGVGVFGKRGNPLAADNIATLQLLDENKDIPPLASITCQYIIDEHDIDLQFDHSVPIQKNKLYQLELKHDQTAQLAYGTEGQKKVECKDGVTFVFSENCQVRHGNGTDVGRGQIPYILYSRLPRIGFGLSFQKANIELMLNLEEANFETTSAEIKLHQFMLSVSAKKQESELKLSLLCRPLTTFKGWIFHTLTTCTFLVDDRSETFEEDSAFSETKDSSTVVRIHVNNLKQLTGEFGNETVLVFEIRFDKGLSYSGVPSIDPMVFDRPWKESDVTLVFDDGKELHCHRQILTLASPVLHTMLEGNFKEKNESRLTITDKSSSTFEKLLRIMYHNSVSPDMDEETAFDLMDIFHEYNMVVQEKRAEQVLMEKVDKNTVLKYLAFAVHLGFDNLVEKCLEVAAAMSSAEIRRNGAYYRLTDDTRSLIQEARLQSAGLE